MGGLVTFLHLIRQISKIWHFERTNRQSFQTVLKFRILLAGQHSIPINLSVVPQNSNLFHVILLSSLGHDDEQYPVNTHVMSYIKFRAI